MFCAVIEALLQAKCVAEVCVEWGDREGVKKGRGGGKLPLHMDSCKTDINQNTLTDLRLPPPSPSLSLPALHF